MTTQYRNIGKIVSVFGLKGELIIHHHLGKKTSLKDLEVIFLEEKKDEFLPYFLESTKIKNENEVFVKLEGLNTKEDGHKFIQKEVWLAEKDFLRYAGKSAPISLVGYHVIHDGHDLGEILEVIEQAHQVLCRIEIKKKEVLIPVNEDTLVKTDSKNKKLHLSLPDGLLDVYL
ncbi:MAG: 16S rRNA processing protein RimM [Bacteroidetes bacterium]|nr:MAG: 16S rRNA processing protein RimM [Bacteroidota bacterium]